MTLLVRRPQKAFALAPTGTHAACCVDVQDLGLCATAYGQKHKVRLVWQLDALTAPRYAPVGAGVATGFVGNDLYAFCIGDAGAIDAFACLDTPGAGCAWSSWAPPDPATPGAPPLFLGAIGSHTRSFGAARPGAPLAAAPQGTGSPWRRGGVRAHLHLALDRLVPAVAVPGPPLDLQEPQQDPDGRLPGVLQHALGPGAAGLRGVGRGVPGRHHPAELPSALVLGGRGPVRVQDVALVQDRVRDFPNGVEVHRCSVSFSPSRSGAAP